MNFFSKMICTFYILFSISILNAQNYQELEHKFNNAKGKPKIELGLKLSELYLNTDIKKSLSYAQNSLSLANEEKSKELILNAYYNLGGCYFAIDSKSDLAIENYTNALDIAISLKNYEKSIDLYNVIAMIYQNKEMYYKSIEYFKNAEQIAIKSNIENDKADIYNNIAISYKNIGDLEKSIQYYLKSLKIMTKSKNIEGAKSLFNNIGNVYLQLENLSKALEYYEKALKITTTTEVNSIKARILNNLAIVNHKLRNFDESMLYYKQSIDIKLKLNEKSSLSTSYLNLGTLYLEINDFTNALLQFNQALSLNKVLNNSQVEANTYNKIGELYLKQKNLQAAKDNIDKSFDMAVKIKNKYLVKDLYERYSEYYLLKGDLKRSLQFKDKYILAKDSIYNIDNNLKLNGMFQRFAIEEKDKELETAKKVQRIIALEAENQKSFSIFLGIIVFLLFVFVYLISKKYIKISSLEKDLEEQNLILKSADEALNIQNAKLIETQKELKVLLEDQKSLNKFKSIYITTIAHEFKNPLTAILNSSSNLEKSFKIHDAVIFKRSMNTVNRSINSLIKQIDEAMFIGRNNLNKDKYLPFDINLVEFIEEIIDSQEAIDKNKHIIEFNKSIDFIEIYFDKTALERIITNLISNALKYSTKNTNVVVSALDRENEVEISVVDFGIGIPKSEQSKLFENFHRFSNAENIVGTGLGLSIVKKIVDFVKGTIAVESDKDQGTKISITLPKKFVIKD